MKNQYVHSEADVEDASPRHNLIAWIGILGGPLIWAAQLQVTYMLVPWACSTGLHWVLHLASTLFLVAASVPAWLAWKSWKGGRKDGGSERESNGAGRERFMGMLGLMLSALFLLLILAQGIPNFFIDPCQQ